MGTLTSSSSFAATVIGFGVADELRHQSTISWSRYDGTTGLFSGQSLMRSDIILQTTRVRSWNMNRIEIALVLKRQSFFPPGRRFTDRGAHFPGPIPRSVDLKLELWLAIIPTTVGLSNWILLFWGKLLFLHSISLSWWMMPGLGTSCNK